jgi:hypothetical protein
VIGGGADAGRLDKGFALELLKAVPAFARERFAAWEDFGAAFPEGECAVKLNNAPGRGFLKKFVSAPHTKPGNPWHRLARETHS